MSVIETFDPGRYLTKVGSADYLEVKWRLVWLRETHPDATIETELVSHDNAMAIFRARVTIPDGGSATGFGSEGFDDFRDYIEKAETKALGRALAALGFGTQFCPDFDFGTAKRPVVDSPIDFASTRGRRMTTAATNAERQVSSVPQPATAPQLKFIQSIAVEIGLSSDELDDESSKAFGRSIAELTRRDASALIERLQSRKSTASTLAAS